MVQALDRLGLRCRQPVVSLAKQREELFAPGRSEPLAVPGGPDSPALRLLRQCRDEAHAFAVRGEERWAVASEGGRVCGHSGERRCSIC